MRRLLMLIGGSGVLLAAALNAQQAPHSRSRLTCDAVNPLSLTVPGNGGVRDVQITDSSDCAWVAVPTQNWISTPLGEQSGRGSASVTLLIAPNNGPERMGHVRLGGRVIVVTQRKGR